MSTASDNTAKWAVRKFGGAGLPVGFEYFTTNPNIPAGSLPLLGGVYSRTLYKDLWNWVQEQTGYLISESEWQEKSAANEGNVPFYSTGDGTTTFRVPSLKCWVKGANGIEEVGSYLSAGLPNIYGTFPLSTRYSSTDVSLRLSGPFSFSYEHTGAMYNTETDCSGRITFNANASNPIYGNSDTVQPPSIVGMWLVKAYGTITNVGSIDLAETLLKQTTEQTSIATEQASIATAKADAASTSATNAAQSYANANAIATQLTEYLATKESLTAPAVDKTLLIEGAAADSKVVGELKSDLDSEKTRVGGNFIAPFTENNGMLYSSTWGAVSNAYKHIVIPVEDNQKITVGINTSETTFVAFLKSYTTPVVSGASIDFCDGTSRYPITSTVKFENKDIPSDCKYIAIVTLIDNTDCSPTEIIIDSIDVLNSSIFEILNYKISTVDADLQANVIKESETDVAFTKISGGFVNATKTPPVISENANYWYSEIYTLTKGNTITVTNKDPGGSGVARISKWNSDGSECIKALATSTSTESTASYTAVEDTEYLRLCGCSLSGYDSFTAKLQSVNVPELYNTVIKRIANSEIVKEEIGKLQSDVSELQSESLQYLSVAMFSNIAVCGDSYTAGAIFNGTTLKGEISETSWGKVLGRRNGIDVTLYAQGGSDTENYQTRATCLPKILSNSAHELYVIALGINDYNTVTIGTIEDINNDYTQNPNTFYGNYGKIIAQIKEHAPNAKIIISKVFIPTLQNGLWYNYSSTAIEEIAAHFNIPYIETKDSNYLCSSKYNANITSNSGHPTAPTYSGIAVALEKLINNCMWDNLSYFTDYLPTSN